MQKTLNYKQALKALDLLDRDPDSFPDSMLPKVLENRKRLKPKRDEWQQDILGQLVQEHKEGELDSGEHMVDAEGEDEGQRLDPESDVTPVEMGLGVRLDDPEAVDRKIGQRLREEFTVELATVPLEQIRHIEGVNGDMDALEQWAFMLET